MVLQGATAVIVACAGRAEMSDTFEDARDRVVTSRSHPRFLGHRGSLGTHGEVSFDGKLALNCFVIEGGEIAVGDQVQLVRGRACVESAAF